jgi:hypothetical protein
MQTPVMLLLAYVASATGYPISGPPPAIVAVPAAFFSHRPECHRRADCAIDGLFVPAKHKIYIQSRLTGVYGDSVRVHELTHFLQLANGAYVARTCANLKAREAEADQVQAEYINTVMAREGKASWVWNENPQDCTNSVDIAMPTPKRAAPASSGKPRLRKEEKPSKP